MDPTLSKAISLHITEVNISFSFQTQWKCYSRLQVRKDFGQILYSLGKKIVKHWTEIYACSYQIIKYHNPFTWLKMWKNLLMRCFFKQSYFFSFFSISFIDLLAFNEKGTKHNKMKSCYILGQERHSCKLEIYFLNYFVDMHFGQWSKQYLDTSQSMCMAASTYPQTWERAA